MVDIYDQIRKFVIYTTFDIISNFRRLDFRVFLDPNQIDFSPFFSRLYSEDLGLTSLVRNHLGSSTGQIGCCVVYQTTFLAQGLLKNFAVDARLKSV